MRSASKLAGWIFWLAWAAAAAFCGGFFVNEWIALEGGQVRMGTYLSQSVERAWEDVEKNSPEDSARVLASLSQHLLSLKAAFPEAEKIYLMEQRGDGDFRHIAGESPRATMVSGMAKALKRVAALDQAEVVVDWGLGGWSPMMLELLPLTDAKTRSHPTVLVMELRKEIWGRLFWRAGLVPLLGLILLLVVAGFWILMMRRVGRVGLESPSYVFAECAALFVVGCVATWMLAHGVKRAEERAVELQFMSLALFHANHVVDTLRGTSWWLRGVDSLLKQAGSWDALIRTHGAGGGIEMEMHPVLDAWALVSVVPHERRAAFEKEMSQRVGRPMEIVEMRADGDFQKAPTRSMYYAVSIVSPPERASSVVGFDMASEPRRKAVLEEAISTNRSVMLGPVRLADRNVAGKPKGLLVVRPVRESGAANNVVGFVVGVLDPARLFEQIFTKHSRRSSGLLLQTWLFQAGLDGKLHALYEPAAMQGPCFRVDSSGTPLPQANLRVPFMLWGRDLVLCVHPEDEFVSSRRTSIVPIVALLGFVMSGGVAAGAAGLLNHRRLLLEEVERQTLAIQESEARFRSLFENSAEAYVWYSGGVFTGCNQAAARLLGVTPDDIIGKAPRHFSPPRQPCGIDSDEMDRRMAQRVMESNQSSYEWQFKHADGSLLWVDVRATQVNYHNQLVIFESWHDITERKRIEADRERLMLAINQANEVILISDAEGKIQFVNPAFEKVTGYTAEEVLGKNPRILKSGEHPPEFYETMWSELRAGRAWEGRIVNRAKNGRLYTEEASINPVHDEEGRIINYIAVKRDITRELELQTQVQHQQKLETVGQLAGSIAHDFNNILQVIVGYAHLLRGVVGESEEGRRDLDELLAATEQGRHLVSGILAFSRRQQQNLKKTDLGKVLARSGQMLQRLLPESIRFEIDIEASLPPVLCDSNQIQQVVMNLCINARDAMPQGGTLRVALERWEPNKEFLTAHPSMKSGLHLRIQVTDTGCGIPDDQLQKIFEPFYTTKDIGHGTGLGLSSALGIVVQHGGVMEVESRLGVGSVFSVVLPVIPESNASHPEDSTAVEGGETADTEHNRSKVILLADDYDLIRNLSCSILTKAGYTVHVAVNGADALKRFYELGGKVDLILSDLMMPNGGGLGLRDAVHAVDATVPFLFMSGYDSSAVTNPEQRLKLRILEKPFTPQALLDRVRESLAAS